VENHYLLVRGGESRGHRSMMGRPEACGRAKGRKHVPARDPGCAGGREAERTLRAEDGAAPS
jgi:hypothetical protein